MNRPLPVLKCLLPLQLLIAAGAVAAEQGSVFTFSTEENVQLRWNAALETGYLGFHVERQPASGGDWLRLTQEPVTRISEVAEIRRRLGFNADAFLTFFQPGVAVISQAEFDQVASDEIARNFIQLFSVKEPAIGAVLGEVYTDTDLQVGQAFRYRVIRIDPAGTETVWATTAQPITHGQADQVPVPQGIRGQAGDTQALVGWEHDDALSRSGQLVGYKVYRATRPFGPFQPLSTEALVPAKVDGQLPEYLLTDSYLTNGTSYWYEVRGMNVLGALSEPSERIEIIPRDMTPPRPPERLTGTLLGDYALLEWSAVQAEDLAGYRVYRADIPDGSFEQLAPDPEGTPVSGTSFLDQDIAEDEVLWYEVTAVDTSGNESLPSPVAEVFRPDITPPEQPQGVVADGRDDGILIQWEANTEEDLAGYYVKRTTRIAGQGAEATVTGEFFTQNVSPLEVTEFLDPVPSHSQSQYAYHVIATDRTGNLSTPSEFVIARVPDIVPPPRVAMSGIFMDGEDVVLEWQPSLDPDLAGYHVHRAPEGSGRFNRLTETLLDPSATRYAHRPTETGAVYDYQVTALDAAGNESEPSFTLSIRYLDLTGPKPPTDLEISVADTGLQLNWTPSASQDVAFLYLFRSAAGTEQDVPLLELAPSETAFLDTQVEENQAYTYFLRAYDGSANAGEPSDRVTATFRLDEEK